MRILPGSARESPSRHDRDLAHRRYFLGRRQSGLADCRPVPDRADRIAGGGRHHRARSGFTVRICRARWQERLAPLSDALLWAGLGAVAGGDAISFAIGRLFKGGRLNTVWPFSRYPGGLIARGESFFRAHGGKSVVIGRFVGPIRPVIPLIAGALTMSWQRFLTFNLLSATGWALVYILPGFFVGSAMGSEIKPPPPPHFYLVLAISGAALVVVYLIVLRIRLGVGEGSWLYQWLESRMSQYDATHRFWRLYSSERPAQQGGEFPLPSLLMTATSLALFLGLSQLVGVSDELAFMNQQVLQWFGALRQPPCWIFRW